METQDKKSRSVATKLAIACVCMFGFGYALVPLYDLFCDLTGLRITNVSKQLVSQEIKEDTSRLVTVQFDVSLNGSMPWEVHPAVSNIKVHPGKVYTTSYIAKNKTKSEMIGQAVPSITPYAATRHLVKTECFCFDSQTIAGGQQVDMPLSFMLDPKLPKDVKVVTLSYTFFDITKSAKINKPDSKESV